MSKATVENTKLSRVMSHALRHAPQEYGFELDSEGWVTIDKLLTGLKGKKNCASICASDIIEVVNTCNKKRYEIKDNKIRACYGHSTPNKVIKEIKEPPSILYHGTARSNIKSIVRDGILPKSRQYVHLSEDTVTANNVGMRHDSKPCILVINAGKAYKDGINFYYGNDTTWLADNIPSRYIIEIR